jgi:hypothetical protein
MSVKDVERGSLHIYSRWPLHISGRWPGEWGLYIDKKEFNFNAGEPKERYHRGEMPESKFLFVFRLRPFAILVFWHVNRLVWIGDRKWKADLKKDW